MKREKKEHTLCISWVMIAIESIVIQYNSEVGWSEDPPKSNKVLLLITLSVWP